MKLIVALISSLLLFGCDPAVQYARVKPDQSTEVQPLNYKTPQKADVYTTRDKLVELQVYSVGGMVGSPRIGAVIRNNRQSAIRVDLKDSYRTLSWSNKRDTPWMTWFDGCTDTPAREDCKTSGFNLPAGASKEVAWTFRSAGFVEFVFVLNSLLGNDNEVHVPLKSCGVFGNCPKD